jgi:branched-chain amino acid aminotransferase
MPNLCNLDGVILAEAEARVPVLDRGFLFGDSIYEVIATRGGVPFALSEHLLRLHESARGIGLDLGVDDRTIRRRLKATLLAAGFRESYVRIVVTRGTGSAPNIDLAHAPGPATHLILVRELPPAPAHDAHLAIVTRLRNDARALDPAVKSGNYLNNVLGLAEARTRGATDALFLNGSGHVTEASTSNVFAVKGGVVLTPPLSAGILAGITRGLLLDMCRQQSITAREQDLTPEDLRAADELFLSSTLRALLPVTRLDGKPVKDGAPGRLTRRLAAAFDSYCDTRLRETDGPYWAAV